ncbi:formyltransferase family protein [Alphaproteobacteria bacterium LSUCC0744]
MSKTRPTLHIFGGGPLVGISEEIAIRSGWSVIFRTGERFMNSIPKLDSSTKVLVGNDLASLMVEGGAPIAGDYGISISAPWIFSQEVIDMFCGELFNLHNQPLPKFRGGGGASWPILMGERSGGCCIHRLVREVDAGEIFARRDFSFPDDAMLPVDFDKFSIEQAKSLLREWLPRLLQERSPGSVIESDDSDYEYWPRLNTEIHGWIDWSWGLEDIFKFCNAFSDPFVGARTLINGVVVEIREVAVDLSKNFHPYQNGMVFRISDGFHVAHRDGILKIIDLHFFESSVKITNGDRFFTPQALLEQAALRRIQYSPSGKVIDLK